MTTAEVSRAVTALLATAALAGGSAGCIHDPSMKLAGARVTSVSLTGVDLTMTMRVHNDNAFDVMVRDVRCDVTLEDQVRLPTVQISPNVWLPADETTNVDVPVTVPWALVPAVIQMTLGSSTIAYRAQGSANVSATRAFAIDFDDFTVDKEGTISRDALVQAASRALLGGSSSYGYGGATAPSGSGPYQQPYGSGPYQQPYGSGPYQQPYGSGPYQPPYGGQPANPGQWQGR